MRTRIKSKPMFRPKGPSLFARVMVLILVVALLGGAGYLVSVRMRTGGGTGPSTKSIGEPSPDLNPAERLALSMYLELRAADLARPAGSDPAPVSFTVSPGDTASNIASRLSAAGLIADSALFTYYMRYNGLDSGIAAGEFSLSSTQTIPEIAAALGRALPDEVTLTIIEGWRMEQVAAALPAAGLEVAPDDFLQLARSSRPGYSFSSDIPQDAGLEGFLFPDTYRFRPDATAAGVLDALLADFDRRVTPEIRQAAASRGLSVYGLVTLASIVEREAVVEDERPLISSVFHNRLAQGMKLDADPTIQYALGYQADTGQWWKRPLTFDDLAFDSPYNTYLYPGLPPTPIANPGLSSIRAAAFPEPTDYLYFRARCDGSGRHSFARTLEEHYANACP